jgi:hypothetical protein
LERSGGRIAAELGKGADLKQGLNGILDALLAKPPT